MKNSIYHGYFIPRNRIGESLTDFEKQHILQFNDAVDLSRTPMPNRFHHFSFIEMNATYLEFVDYYFTKMGRPLGFGTFGMTILMIVPIFMIVFFTLFLDPPFYIALFLFIPMILLLGCMCLLNIKALKYHELQGYYCLPARLNRKNRKIYLYLRDGTQIERNLDEVVLCISHIRAFMDTKDFVISVFELDQHGKITSHSTLGKSSYNKSDIVHLWKFIQVYWVHGPEPLMPTHVKDTKSLHDRDLYLNYCHDIQSKEEKISDSWKIIRLEYYMNPFLYLICIPYDLLHLVTRRICLKRRIMPVWNEEIEQKNQVNPNDPFRVTAKDSYIFGMSSMKKPKA